MFVESIIFNASGRMDSDYKTSGKKQLTRVISFVTIIILASIAVMFSTFIDSTLLLAVILIPCVITLSLEIVPVSFSIRTMVICWIISCAVSIIAIIYVLIQRPEMVKQYLTF